MKYQIALAKKELKVEDLSQQTQKKIKELHSMSETLAEVVVEELNEEEKNNYEKFKANIDDLDTYLEKAINKFDKEEYKKRIEILEANRLKRTIYQQKSESSEEEIEEKVELKEIPVPKTEVIQETKSSKVDINTKIDNLKREVEINTEKFQTQEEEEEEEVELVEAEEFIKKSERKPKKMSLGIILMCAGFGLLTFGAVNFFKERR